MSLTHRLTLAAALVLATAGTQAQEARTAKLSVNGMVCAFCAQGIEKRLTAMPENGPLYINLGKKVVAVEAKPGQTLNIDKLKSEVNEAGYEVTAVEMVPKTVAAVRAEMTGRK